MNGKTITVWVIIIIVLIAGLYFIIKGTFGSQAATQQAAQAIATTTAPNDTQVQAQDRTVGTGAEAKPGMLVSVLYVGKLTDGTTFDSSDAHGNQPLKFVLGTQGLIPGFQIGINGMKEGGERLMAVPPTLGYGTQEIKDPSGKVIVPANSTLIFDVKLVKVEAAPEATPTPNVSPTKK